MIFKDLAVYLDKLEKTPSRIEITSILAELFKKAEANEIDKLTYLILGGLAPSYKNVVFNIAERMMLQVVAQAYRVDLDKVKKLYKTKGDIGDVSQELAVNKKAVKADTSVLEVYKDLVNIAKDEGEGSQERKITKTAELLLRLDPLSTRFVARIPVGKLRLGFSDKTIIDALSWMEHGDKSAKESLEQAYYVLPDVGLLAKSVKEKGIKKTIQNPNPVVGIPVMPMLAQRLKSPTQMIKKMGEVAVEPKFDGLRISIHHKAGKKGFVKAFTRNMNETSWMFPELTDIKKYTSANELILDTEAVGLDEKSKAMVNFQTTMKRRRKHEIESFSSKVPIKFYVFDIMLKDGKNLMNLPYKERREILGKTVKDGKLLQLVDYTITKDSGAIEKLMEKELSEGLEGIIVKRANSRYIPGRTGWRWVKMKEAEEARAKLADTVDCVVMGYSAGRGRRAGFGVGQFLVGIKDKEKIKTITKVGTGITDEQFIELKIRLSKLEIEKKPKEYIVHKELEPDHWVEPKLVVEIAADEITKSPKHTAGYALRFPRLVRFRDDKNANQATSIKELIKLYELQSNTS